MLSADRLKLYAELVRLNRPIGIYLLLWPTVWALLIAGDGFPDITVTIVFVVGVVLMRSAGCAINDYADRDIDVHVQRTKDRPVTSGRIQPVEALQVFVVLSLVAFLLVVFFLNALTLWFSVIAAALAASYPFTKRLHYLPQVHLGAAFAWAVPMAFVAQTNQWPPPEAWVLFTATLLWTTAYDTMYGMVDREDDIKIGVKSTAILFGEADRLIIGILQALVIGSLLLIGSQKGLGWVFYLSLLIASGLALYQQLLIRERAPESCFRAFLNNHYFGMVIAVGISVSYWWP